MYRHHEESLKIMEDYFRKRKEVIALIFGGSVAKGMERPRKEEASLPATLLSDPGCFFPLTRRSRGWWRPFRFSRKRKGKKKYCPFTAI